MKKRQENKKPGSEISKSPEGAKFKNVGNSTTRKIIGFDMDGVVLDHTENKLLLIRKFNLNIKKEETPSDLIKQTMPLPVYRKFQIDLNDNPKFRYLCTPMPGVKQALEKIIKSKVPYFLVSRRKKPLVAIKILKHHGLWPKYFNKTNAFFVLTPEDKDKKAKELKITHYFDDQQTILDKLISVKNKFLFDSIDVFKNPSPFGRVRDKNSGYARVKSWKEIAKLI